MDSIVNFDDRVNHVEANTFSCYRVDIRQVYFNEQFETHRSDSNRMKALIWYRSGIYPWFCLVRNIPTIIKLFMSSFTLCCQMIPNIHLNRDSLIPKTQFDLIVGKLSITFVLTFNFSGNFAETSLVLDSVFVQVCKIRCIQIPEIAGQFCRRFSGEKCFS